MPALGLDKVVVDKMQKVVDGDQSIYAAALLKSHRVKSF